MAFWFNFHNVTMQKHEYFLKSIGKLIQQKRAESMDQTQLGQRVGLSRNTISAIENGKATNAGALFKVLDYFDLLAMLQDQIDEQLTAIELLRERKARNLPEMLDNDF